MNDSSKTITKLLENFNKNNIFVVFDEFPNFFSFLQESKTEEWQIRIREIQGAICVASVVQVVIGYFGKSYTKFKMENFTF
jgi:hypothetical protein